MNKPLIVVGTPGRLTELSRMGRLQTHNCPILVLDEVSFYSVKPTGAQDADEVTGEVRGGREPAGENGSSQGGQGEGGARRGECLLQWHTFHVV